MTTTDPEAWTVTNGIIEATVTTDRYGIKVAGKWTVEQVTHDLPTDTTAITLRRTDDIPDMSGDDQ